MYKKSKKFFPKVTAILHKKNLPNEYQVLLALESAFNANAVSKAGAVGYWQIMDEVAQEYGLTYEPQLTDAEKKKLEAEAKKTAPIVKQEKNIPVKKTTIKDDRKNFIRSTNAAARYLKERSRNLNNDMLLIVASYNCGVGNVWEAKRKTGLNNPSFWDIKKFLPAETQNYVMNFIALNVIFNNYKKFESNTMSFKPEKIKVITEEQMVEELTVENNAMDY
jgi:membrane-bound lytic murein transglycosylase D